MKRPRQRIEAGFTLIEVLLAVAITAIVMTAVGITFVGTLQAREDVTSLTESTEAGPKILALLERDLQGIWTYNIQGNRVLRGRNMDVAGTPADRIDFLTSTDSINLVTDSEGQLRRASYCEVGYWLKRSSDLPDLLELWRREDPLVDNDLLTGGQFQLVHDRVKEFNLTYYKTVGTEAEEFHEWDSFQDDALPRVIKVEFTIERKLPNANRTNDVEIDDFEGVLKKYVHYVVLDNRYPEILTAGVAMVPVLPGRPETQENGSGGPAGGGGGGPAGGGRGGGAAGEGQGRAGGDRPPGERGDRGRRETGNRPPPGGGNGMDLRNLLRGSGGGNGIFGGGGGGGRR
jgi:prepilin-type N-terminal cleavage/methylation domain-containing protein